MALTVTDRGTGTHNTGATTLVPGGRTATLATGSMGVLCIALDNAGGAGDVVIAPNSWTDAKGNVWTLRINALYDNGAASAGIEMAFYTAPITVDLLTTDAGTMTWKTGVSPVAKVWTWYEVIPGASATPTYSTGGNIAGATAANAQVTTASVLVGDAVIAGYFSENTAAVTQDSDSTNGSWTAQQTTTIGTTTAGVRIATQQKVQTTAASTQSYDVTVSSQDRIAGYILIHESPLVTVAAGLASITVASSAPTESEGNLPTTASTTLTAQAPTVSENVFAGAGAVTITAPNAATLGSKSVDAGLASSTVSASSPTPSEGTLPAAASVTTSAQAPVANLGMPAGSASLATTASGPAPDIRVNSGLASVTLTAQSGTSSEGVGAGSAIVSLAAGDAAVSGRQPAGSGSVVVAASDARPSAGAAAGAGSLALAADAPLTGLSVNAEAAQIIATAYNPSIPIAGAHVEVNAQAAFIIATAYNPAILGGTPSPPPPFRLIRPAPYVVVRAGVARVGVVAHDAALIANDDEDLLALLVFLP